MISARTLASCLVLLLACGDSGAGGAGGGASGAGGPGGGRGDGAGGVGQGGAALGGGAQGGAMGFGGCPQGGAPAGFGGAAVSACSDLGASDCFSNYDCAAGDRCQNAGTVDLPVPCCVPGPRGDKPAGAPCLGENDCASSLCLEGGMCGGICTDRCTTAADCPAELSDCIPIAFSGSNDKFCLPP